MKYKAMLCACLHVVSSYVPEEHREEIYGKLPLYNSIDEQVNYFESNVDIKRIETLIYKPMVKENKRKEKESQKPVKEKKPKTQKEPKEVKPKEPKTPKEDKPKEPKTPKKKKQDIAQEAEEILETETQERVSTPILNESQELDFENVYCDIASPIVEANPIHDTGAKTKSKVSNDKSDSSNAPKTDKTKVVKKKEPKTEKPKVVKKKEPKTEKPKVVKKKEKKEASPDVDHYMVPPLVIPDGKYWTTDEHFQNGPLYNNKRDEDGDSIAGVLVGKLVNGTAVFEP